MTDTRVAALAAALEVAMPDSLARIGGPYAPLTSPTIVVSIDRAGYAAAILAALPADWCGHKAEIARLNIVGAEAMAQLATLRAIEEAARDLTEKEPRGTLNRYRWNALRAALAAADPHDGETPVRMIPEASDA